MNNSQIVVYWVKKSFNVLLKIEWILLCCLHGNENGWTRYGWTQFLKQVFFDKVNIDSVL